MRLLSVYETAQAPAMLYTLLKERTPKQSISHRGMPTMKAHMAFYLSRPYAAWYLIVEKTECVGAIYLTHAGEIGIQIYTMCKGNGYGPKAIKLLMKQHDRVQYLANINPANEPSIRMFEKLGFTHIQNTLCLRRQS